MGGWLWFTSFCKILPRSDLLDASLRHPSSVAIDSGTGESSRCKRVSTSTLRPDSRATTTHLNRPLSALIATVWSLSSETGTEYKVSKVFNFCCFKLSWNFTSFLINLTWTNSYSRWSFRSHSFKYFSILWWLFCPASLSCSKSKYGHVIILTPWYNVN